MTDSLGTGRYLGRTYASGLRDERLFHTVEAACGWLATVGGATVGDEALAWVVIAIVPKSLATLPGDHVHDRGTRSNAGHGAARGRGPEKTIRAWRSWDAA